MTCIPLLCIPGVLQKRSHYRPAILRTGRPTSSPVTGTHEPA